MEKTYKTAQKVSVPNEGETREIYEIKKVIQGHETGTFDKDQNFFDDRVTECQKSLSSGEIPDDVL
tara:strand:- start:9 stop:206 length:198 start_codon:yes stop_codon:yes gene_type:complete